MVKKIRRIIDRIRGYEPKVLGFEEEIIMVEKPTKIFVGNWIGEIAEGVTSVVRFNGEPITSRKIKCSACGARIDVNLAIDFQIGSKLASVKNDFQDCIRYMRGYAELQEKARNARVTFDGYLEEQESLNVEYAANATRYEGTTVQADSVYITCPKCRAALGNIDVELSRKTFESTSALTLEEMDELPFSHRMAARITHDLRFRDVTELQKWRDFQDIKKAKALINDFLEKIVKTGSPDIVNILYDVQSAASRALDSLDREILNRRRILKDAVLKIVQTEKVKAIA